MSTETCSNKAINPGKQLIRLKDYVINLVGKKALLTSTTVAQDTKMETVVA
jgi:hypothetical protein